MTLSAGERTSSPSPSPAPAMEPLAQRLRLHQSVEVDESNPDYIRKKREGEIALKNSFDAIIAKYEKMPESASDIIDMSTGRVVVDNGHLRSIQQQDPTMQAAQFLGNFLEDNRGIDLDDEDDWDELAPPELSKPNDVKKKATKEGDADRRGSGGTATIEKYGQTDAAPAHLLDTSIPQTPSGVLAQIQPSPMPFTVPMPQNPQTLLTPEGQNAFIINLNLAMNQFVTNTMASVTNMFGNAAGLPALSTPLTQTVFTPTIPLVTNDSIRPGTDPNWWFPPLPPRAPRSSLAVSSPIAAVHSERKRRRSFEKPSRNNTNKRQATQAMSHQPSAESLSQHHLATEHIGEHEDEVRSSPASARVAACAWQLRDRITKFNFTPEDDLHIIEQREVFEAPWETIRQSREKWKTWPVYALINRYTKRLKIRYQDPATQSIHEDGECLSHTPETGSERQERTGPEEIWQASYSPQVRPTPRRAKRFRASRMSKQDEQHEQLLTPTSLESQKDPHESPVTFDEPAVMTIASEDEDAPDVVSNSPEIPETQQDACFTSSSVPPEDAILPSIEAEANGSVDYPGHDEESAIGEAWTTSTRPQLFVKPPSKKGRIRRPANPIKATMISETLADDTPDELERALLPSTPVIKQEETTPPPFFTALLSTPKSAPHLPLDSSSVSRATPRSGRQKRLYNNSVKAMWAKRGKPAAKNLHALKKTKSMQDVRSKLVDDWSEDDLA